MIPETDNGRRAKGVNLLGLAKVLRVYRKSNDLNPFSAETQAVLDGRILISSWYPLRTLWELQERVFATILQGDPKRMIEFGASGGEAILGSTHRAFIDRGSPRRTLEAMRYAWPAYFNFGSVSVEAVDAHTWRFTLEGYPDVPVYHGMAIAGWHLAAARAIGMSSASVVVIEKPWEGAPQQVHVVRLAPGGRRAST